jgi:hypothetical protein
MTNPRAERFPLIRAYLKRHEVSQDLPSSKTLTDIRRSVREKIFGAVEEAIAIDGCHGADAVTTEAGCLCASIAAQIGGAEGLKTHLDNVERDGRSQLPDYQLWTPPELP